MDFSSVSEVKIFSHLKFIAIQIADSIKMYVRTLFQSMLKIGFIVSKEFCFNFGYVVKLTLSKSTNRIE